MSVHTGEQGNGALTGTVIVAFTKDWDDVPTCTTHLLRQMGRTIPVLWVGSIGTRKPHARSRKDWMRVLRRIAKGLLPAVHKENRLYVLHPLILPQAQSRWARSLNRLLMGWYLRRFWRSQEKQVPCCVEYWCFVPNAVDFLPPSGAGRPRSRVVYYVADDWTAFHHLDGAWLAAKEHELLARADWVFATAPYLVDKLGGTRRELGRTDVRYMSHGVDYAQFARALDRSAGLPLELVALPRPIIGFYGNLHPWVDFSLVETLARERPQWSFVLIGENYAAPASLERLSNVHLLGRREHATLPDYCRGFDAGIIPYDMRQPRMESVNPVKTKELLAAGVPVVASAVPVLASYGDGVLVCRVVAEWVEALERQISRGAAERLAFSESMQAETWEAKARSLRGLLDVGEGASADATA